MKIRVISGILMLLFSCKGQNEASLNNELNEANDKETMEQIDELLVPSYDFEAFSHFLEKDNDTTYVINFWATWCKPCIKELPAFERIHDEYGPKKVKVILASLDFPKQVNSHLIPFIDKHQIRSEVVLLDDPDGNSWIPKVDTSWTGAIPATIIYNSKHRKFYERTFSFEELEMEINSINKL